MGIVSYWVLKPSTCSYAYAPWLNLQTHPDTAIMADSKNKFLDTSGAVAWGKTNGTHFKSYHNHGQNGVNVLYVGGNARWVSTNPYGARDAIPQEAVPNCITDGPYSLMDLKEAY